MTNPIDRIVHTIPAPFFRAALEQLDAAFMKAAQLTEQNIAEPERRGTLAQIRHALAEEGFRLAARDAGLKTEALETDPQGGRYSLVKAGGIYLIRSNIQPHCGTPRPTKFRQVWSALNAWLDPLQLDLLRIVDAPESDLLCGMLVVTAHGRGGDPSVPAFVGLGIPRADLSGWVHLEPLTTLIGRYHDLETAAKAPAEAPVEVKDIAVPRLKRRAEDNN